MVTTAETGNEKLFIEDEHNPRGIPSAVFISDVPEYIKKFWGNSVEGCESVLKQLHELYAKYKFMENKLISQKRSLIQKIPEIESALEALNFVISQDTPTVCCDLELSDAVYATAEIERDSNVCLWLGANVMVEYPHAEAKGLLTTNLTNAKETLGTLNTHLDFIKDCITITEVNISRTHNQSVQLKAAAKKEDQQ